MALNCQPHLAISPPPLVLMRGGLGSKYTEITRFLEKNCSSHLYYITASSPSAKRCCVAGVAFSFTGCLKSSHAHFYFTEKETKTQSNMRNVTQLVNCQGFCQGLIPRSIIFLFYYDSSLRLSLNMITYTLHISTLELLIIINREV